MVCSWLLRVTCESGVNRMSRVALLPRLQHRLDDASNTPESPFDFTEENYKIVKTILAKYPKNYKQARSLLVGRHRGGAKHPLTPRDRHRGCRSRPQRLRNHSLAELEVACAQTLLMGGLRGVLTGGQAPPALLLTPSSITCFGYDPWQPALDMIPGGRLCTQMGLLGLAGAAVATFGTGRGQ